MEAKKKLLFNDFVVQYMLCNFNCEYCINKLRPDKSSIWKKTDYYNSSTYEHRDLKNFIYSGTLKKNIDDAIDKSREIIDTPILRISGGEILMMKNVKDLLKSLSSKYEIVQIVTNGYFLDKGMIDFLKLIGNIHIMKRIEMSYTSLIDCGCNK